MAGPAPFEMARMNNRSLSQAAFIANGSHNDDARPTTPFRRAMRIVSVLVAVMAMVATIAIPLILAAQ